MTKTKIPTPAPADIETVVAAIKDHTDPFLRWGQLDYEAQQAGDTIEDNRKPMAFEGTLYRAETINPQGLCGEYWGMGTTPVAAAASAWIGANLGELWWQSEVVPGGKRLTEEDYAGIPREVPAGWSFVLYGVPDSEQRATRRRS